MDHWVSMFLLLGLMQSGEIVDSVCVCVCVCRDIAQARLSQLYCYSLAMFSCLESAFVLKGIFRWILGST